MCPLNVFEKNFYGSLTQESRYTIPRFESSNNKQPGLSGDPGDQADRFSGLSGGESQLVPSCDLKSPTGLTITDQRQMRNGIHGFELKS